MTVTPRLLMVLTLRGYEVAITTNGDTVRVTCPELPQLSVSDASLDSALALAEDAIAAIRAGRTSPNGHQQAAEAQ